MPRAITLSENIRPILGAIRTVPIPAKLGEAPPPKPAVPFITISREPGAGAWTLAERLVDALNRDDPGEQQWTRWDRELVEKVAADFQISDRLVESLEKSHHSWLGDFLASLAFNEGPDLADEQRIFRKVASTVRALAQTGRVILVGRGGVFLTRQMPGGIHIRLVAPLEQRITNMAELLNVTRDQAEKTVREMTRLRDAFYRRYWPQEPLSPYLFTATLNTAALPPETAVRVIVEMVKQNPGR